MEHGSACSRASHGLLALALVLGAFAPAAAGQSEPAATTAAASDWNARNVEHLFNRAGFGARPNEIGYALRIGRDEFVEQLFTGFTPEGPDDEPFYIEHLDRPARRAYADEDSYRKALDEFRRSERSLLFGYAGWWVEQMLDARDPLRERMVLFWHGYFTSSVRDVRSVEAMARQNALFRRLALGNFRDLLRAAVRDPALIEYLDNNQNRRGNPNENLARELMELFTLGAGHYTEEDIKEGARALTGWRTNDERTESYFVPRLHDGGKKTILGRTGRFDADDFLDILLEQPACSRWLARKLLAHFEGVEPDEARLAEYAAVLREGKFEVAPFLRKLFEDPRFYRDDVVGERISSPIEYLVGTTRRLGIDVPPAMLWLGAGQLGQRLFDPPNVKGWEGGESWITTSSLLARGNMAGMLLGVVQLEDVLADEPLELDEPEMEPMSGEMSGSSGASSRPARKADAPRKADGKANDKRAKPDLGPEMSAMRRLVGEFYYPRIHLSARVARLGASTDAAIVDALADELLPSSLSAESRGALLDFLVLERAALKVPDGKLLDAGGQAEQVLRRLAHLILSLPEAQVG
jgi:uncharacterized protein (DUF1800 family)